MKKFKYLFVILFITVFLCGCGTTKSVPEPRDVQKVLEEYKFDVFDTTEQVGYSESALYATKGQVKANYVKGSKKYDIQGIFLDECKNIYKKVTANYKKKDDGGKNWTNLTVTDDDKFYFVGWIEDSYIVIESPVDQEKLMKTMVKELGFK